jgi:hypothetical protein
MDIVTQLEATADKPDSELEIVSLNLYQGVSTRPTKHAFEFTQKATDEFKEYVIENIENSTYDLERENNIIRLTS